ncbi:hypothetical protein BH23ACT4_BH23ACT4_16980 [soil metagenome]
MRRSRGREDHQGLAGRRAPRAVLATFGTFPDPNREEHPATPKQPPTRVLLEQPPGGCGCGCDHTDNLSPAESTDTKERDITSETTSETATKTYAVTGMTCGHCVQAVTSELQALEGVHDVAVDLDAGGVSSVTVTSTAALEDARVESALDEAGDYHLAS